MNVPLQHGEKGCQNDRCRGFPPKWNNRQCNRERERGREKLAAKSRGFFADQRIADCHSLARSLEFVAISLQFEVLSRTGQLLLDLRKGNRNYKQTIEALILKQRAFYVMCHFRGHEALKYSAAPRSGNDIMYSTSRRIR